MRLGILGPVVVWDGEGRPVAVPGVKVRALLALLLIHRGSVVSVDRLADALWGDAPPARVEAVLRSKVSQLRQVIKRAGGDAGQLLRWEAGGYRLDADAGVTDVDRFAELVALADQDATRLTALELLASAEGLWRGEPFGEFRHERYAMAAAAELTEQRLQVRERRAELRIDNGESTAVVGELSTAAEEHPLRESVHVLLMSALYQAGRQAEALEVYQALAERLKEQMGVDPGPRALRGYTDILRQEQPIREPAVERQQSPVDLPAPLTPLVAREAEQARLSRLVREARLVAVTGAGGIGKTRLSVAVAHEMLGDFPDGVVFVDLSGVRGRDESEVLQALAERLGVRDDPASGSEASPGLWFRLTSAVLVKRMLLVVDNCEQAVDVIAPVVERLLAAAPELRMIATSREPLKVSGERVMPLGPLSVPAAEQPVDDPSEFGAYRLFERLVTDAGGTFDSPETALRICRRLDGLPLALELAAARVRTLGLGEVDRRLDDRFRLLTSGPRTTGGRHRTLEAVITWSWDLADEQQRRALRRLAFAEDWTLEAAEALAGPDVDVLATVPALVDQSLVQPDLSGRARYRMLESVRAFGLERLREAGEERGTAERHRWYCRTVVDRWTPALRGAEQDEALAALRGESANLRRAIETSEAPVDQVISLLWFWVLTGRLTEARGHLKAALDTAERGSAAEWIARCWAETLRLRMADDGGLADPGMDLESALTIEGPLAGPARLAGWYLSMTRTALGIPPGEPVPIVAPTDSWGRAATLLTEAAAALAHGRTDRAADLAADCLGAFGAVGDRWGRLQALDVLSHCALDSGDSERADGFDREALELAESLRLLSDLSRVLSRMGRHALRRGDLNAAAAHYGRARRIAGEQCDVLVAAEAEGGLRAVETAQRMPVTAVSARYLKTLELCDLYADHPGRKALAV